MKESPNAAPVSHAAQEWLDASREFGVRPEDPEGKFVAATADLVTAIEQKIEGWEPPVAGKVAQVIRNVASREIHEAGAAIAHAARWKMAAVVAGAVALSLAAGGYGGFQAGWMMRGQHNAWTASELQRAFSAGGAGADFLANLVENNDPGRMAKACRESRYEQAGGTACTLSVWTKRPG